MYINPINSGLLSALSRNASYIHSDPTVTDLFNLSQTRLSTSRSFPRGLSILFALKVKMFEDMEQNMDPSYWYLALIWGGTLAIVMWTSLVLNYISSKTPAQKTIMDFVSASFLKLLVVAKLCSACIATLTTFLTDSGEVVALIFSWAMFIIGQTILLEILMIVTLQLLYVMHPWLLGSSAFESVYKCAIVIGIPAMAVTQACVIAYLGYHVPPITYQLLRVPMPHCCGCDTKGHFIFRTGLLSFAVVYSTLAKLFIRIKDPSCRRPNYMIRLDILAVCCFQQLVAYLLVPSYMLLANTLVALEFFALYLCSMME